MAQTLTSNFRQSNFNATFFTNNSTMTHTLILATTTLIYFGVMYLQVWAGIHQFTPVMVLPLVLFWRKKTKNLFRWKRVKVRAAPCHWRPSPPC